MGQDIDFPHDETERKSYYPGEYLVPIAKEFVKANPDCAKALTKDLTQEQLETLSSFAKAQNARAAKRAVKEIQHTF